MVGFAQLAAAPLCGDTVERGKQMKNGQAAFSDQESRVNCLQP